MNHRTHTHTAKKDPEITDARLARANREWAAEQTSVAGGVQAPEGFGHLPAEDVWSFFRQQEISPRSKGQGAD